LSVKQELLDELGQIAVAELYFGCRVSGADADAGRARRTVRQEKVSLVNRSPAPESIRIIVGHQSMQNAF
jgi:hypothetical protein